MAGDAGPTGGSSGAAGPTGYPISTPTSTPTPGVNDFYGKLVSYAHQTANSAENDLSRNKPEDTGSFLTRLNQAITDARNDREKFQLWEADASQDSSGFAGLVLSGVEAWNQADAAGKTKSGMSPLEQLLNMFGSSGGSSGPSSGGSSIAMKDPLPTTPDEQDAYVRSHYGFMAGYLSDPELGSIIREAASKGWTPELLQGAIMNTNYWKNSSTAMRTWDALSNTDPASAREKVAQLTQDLKAQAQKLGINITGSVDLGAYGGVQDRLSIFAATALRQGWTQQMITDGLLHEAAFDPSKDPGAGQISATRDAIKKSAGAYMVDVSDTTANQWAADIMSNHQTMEGVNSLFKQQAKGRYASLAPQIDQGFTPEQFFSSYKQGIAKELELDPSMINMMDPKWSKIVDYADPKTGMTRPMTLSEAQQYVRTQPEWDGTKGAQQMAANASDLIGKTFGKIG